MKASQNLLSPDQFVNRQNASSDEEMSDFQPEELDEKNFIKVNENILKFCKEKLSSSSLKKYNSLSFEKTPIFNNEKIHIKIIQPYPQVYFMPRTILIKNANLQILKERIILYYQKQKQQCKLTFLSHGNDFNKLQAKIHNETGYYCYQIKSVKEFDQKLLEIGDFSTILNPLFEFYETNYVQFNELCSILLFWAHLRGILDDDFLSFDGFKILILFFLINQGFPNIVHEYSQKNRQSLENLRTMYKVNQSIECQVDKNIVTPHKFMIRQKKGFYIVSQKKFMKSLQILPIPYPISKIKKLKKQTISPCLYFYKFFYFIEEFLRRPKTLTIDLRRKKAYTCSFSSIGLKMRIIHPVHNEILCDKLCYDQQNMKKIRAQFERVIWIIKKQKDPLNAFERILVRD